MPIQINELTITVEVTDTAQQANMAAENDAAADMRALIRECVEEVMEVLKNKNER